MKVCLKPRESFSFEITLRFALLAAVPLRWLALVGYLRQSSVLPGALLGQQPLVSSALRAHLHLQMTASFSVFC